MARLMVGAAQISCRNDDVMANVAVHLSLIAEARQNGVDLLLFPELSLTGYAGGANAAARGEVPGPAIIETLTAACGTMAVSVGIPQEGATGIYYVTQILLHDGAIIHRHRKINLATYGQLEEGKHFAAGRVVEPVRMGEWTIATLICADTWNPALPWLAALSGADVLLVPIASSIDALGGEYDQAAGWDVNLRHTALTYGLPVVMANQIGAGGFWGGSRVIDANGKEIARAETALGLCRAELDSARIRHARRLLPTIRNATPELVAGELNRRLQIRDP